MKPNPVGWFEIYVQDMDRARRFYEGVFQGQLEKLPTPDLDMWNFPMDMDRMGSAGALVRAPGVPSGGSGTLIYFSSEECTAEEARAVEFGGRVERSKMSIGPYGFIALLVDPDGNRIGLHSLK